jgi:beta-carotene isomerase
VDLSIGAFARLTLTVSIARVARVSQTQPRGARDVPKRTPATATSRAASHPMASTALHARSCAFALGEGLRASSSSSSSKPKKKNVATDKSGRRRRATTTTRAILVQQPPEPPREPTWQERLGDFKNDGPKGVGRKNRGPRRRIVPHIKESKGSEENVPNSNPERLKRWKEENARALPRTLRSDDGDDDARGGAGAGGTAEPGANSTPRWAAHKTDARSTQRAETMSYSFLGQSTVRYPAAAHGTPEAKATYVDSPADKLAIEMNVRMLSELAHVKPRGDPTSYDALVEAALVLRDATPPEKLRSDIGNLMRKQITSGMPPFALGAMQALVPSEILREMNATVASEAAEWMFGPTTRETLAGQGGKRVTVVNVKKCRYLEASGCASVCVNQCKLPAQDVMRSEFGTPVYMQPNFNDCSCRMFFGQEPLPESIDPAIKALGETASHTTPFAM